jgi:type II secretory pathway pseudopilin PulG
MKWKPLGFTVIEFAILIAILAILVAIVVSRLVKYPSGTGATTAEIASSLNSANANNYATRSLNNTLGVAVANCTDVAKLLTNGLPSDYQITPLPIPRGKTESCTVVGPGTAIDEFSATGIK